MEHHPIVYRCTGSCGGVAPVAKNCGADSCNKFDQPLEAVVQCHACMDAGVDGKLHACGMCEPA